MHGAQPVHSRWPSVWHAPHAQSRNLIASLAGAASSTHFRLEDQLTEALAWLLSRSRWLALETVKLYLEEDAEALAIIGDDSAVGISTQVRLPPLGRGSHLRPDLSIAVGSRELQLLVEAKVEAEFSLHDSSRGTLAQPSAYIAAWSGTRLDQGREARLRRVGTLTLKGEAPPADHPWRAADRRWEDIAALVATAIESERLPTGVIAAADDLREFIVDWLGDPVVSAGLLEAGAELTRGLAQALAAIVPAAKVTGQFGPRPDNHFCGGYLEFDVPVGGRDKLWIVLTAAGGSYNPRGAPTTLWLVEAADRPLSPSTAARLEGVGFERLRDRAGYKLLRAGLEVEEDDVIADPAASVAPALEWASGLLVAAGLAAPTR